MNVKLNLEIFKKKRIIVIFYIAFITMSYSCSTSIKINNTTPTGDDRTAMQKQYDQKINAKVSVELINSKIVKSAEIEISTYKNVVTLYGVVATKVQKKTALNLALSVNGVKTVISDILVQP